MKHIYFDQHLYGHSIGPTPNSENKITIREIQAEISNRNICSLGNRKGEPVYKGRLQTDCLGSIFDITDHR